MHRPPSTTGNDGHAYRRLCHPTRPFRLARTWYHRVIPGYPEEAGKNAAGTQLYGPSGAPVWASPTVDAGRGLVSAPVKTTPTRPRPRAMLFWPSTWKPANWLGRSKGPRLMRSPWPAPAPRTAKTVRRRSAQISTSEWHRSWLRGKIVRKSWLRVRSPAWSGRSIQTLAGSSSSTAGTVPSDRWQGTCCWRLALVVNDEHRSTPNVNRRGLRDVERL